MSEFAKYTPSSWMEEGLVVRPAREALPQPRVKEIGAVAAAFTMTLSVLSGGIADHGVWGSVRGDREVEVPQTSHAPSRSVLLEFEQLVREWRSACAFLSSTTKRTAHPAFRRIVGMGYSAVPLLLQHLDQPGDWDIALAEILGEDPVPASARGNRDATVAAWRTWAARNGWSNAGQSGRA